MRVQPCQELTNLTGRPRHPSLTGALKKGVTIGETPQKGMGKGDGTTTSRSASGTRATQEVDGGREEFGEYKPKGSPNRHSTRELNWTPRSERRQRFEALGRDTQALAQELVRKDEKESDEEDTTDIRILNRRRSFNFLA